MRSFHLPGRSPVFAKRAMVATSHPLASLTAIETLKAGGNAVDAAIATAAMLAVVEPQMTGIGGDCFALVAKPGRKKIVALNASGRAPAAATPDRFASLGVRQLPVTSVHAVTVPGAVDGWTRLLADHGTMPLARVLAPAIETAEKGFVVAPRVAADWVHAEAKIKASNAGARRHLLLDDRAPRAGETFRFKALAATLKAIAEGGRDAFYDGPVAADMVKELNALGGLHTRDDFGAQAATYVEPISVSYRGVDLVELPPNNHGFVALLLLKMLEKLGVPAKDPAGSERFHLYMEAARLAYAVRDEMLADPDVAKVPIEHMISDALVATLVKRISRRERRAELGPIPRPKGSDTVCFSIVDEKGMVVSFINSLFSDFGSGLATAKTGVVFHNRGSGFVLDPAHPNCIAPRKRPLHTLIPAMALKGGKPWLAYGVMGAAFQPMGHVYALTNIVDYGMDPQEAVDAPRVFFEGERIEYEDGVSAAAVAEMRRLGHPMARRDMPWGGAQLVMIDAENGCLVGASDGRKDGLALGY